jgi:hypothetical protein
MTRARILADYVAGGTTAAEFDFMDGVTSNVQTQLTALDTAKAPKANPAFTGTPTGITAAHITSGALPVGVTGGLGLDAIKFLENNTTQDLSGTYSTGRLYVNDSYRLTGDITVTGHLALGTLADSDVEITQDSTERTITGSGTIESGRLMNSVNQLVTAPSLILTPGSAPATTEGAIYYDSATDSVKVYNGVGWNMLLHQFNGTGGTTSSYLLDNRGYRVHTFTTSGTFTISASGKVDILIIAGGGGGGSGSNQGEGGGGGAGGVKYFSQKTLAVGDHTVTVGLGGAGSTGATARGVNGQSSSIGSLSTVGGGGGGSRNTSVQPGALGGSGGGGGQRDNDTANHGAGTANQGNNGGSGFEGAQMSGGGGGGAGGVGTSSPSTGVGGAGGAGIVEGTTALYDWTLADGTTATFKINGTTNSYAGGGGGSGQTTAANGQHGGGNGGTNNASGTNGTGNTGGGGGGMNGNGGSGIVIVRYAI